MSHEKISVTFEQDHDRLDALFTTFQQQKRKDMAKAKEAFVEFKFGLQRHIVWEEDVLFPKWEENSGMAEGGPTQVMRTEHRIIGECLEAIHQKVQASNPDSNLEEQRLVDVLKSHNMKEERILYPSIDQVITDQERAELYQAMKDIPEERYRTCCGSGLA
ncbi:MAG TPA: hemerythrin domain-containing protein [Nitrospira sp.]|nr:hemerythrin domain-containing protein [Nitrospira sp.]HMU31349.1 hemerythrin domain-containing protein [Nitrospira sp.]HMX91245.1 hemerythrin domain-containing protein [Nitrospira sp.]HNA87638.1 hemerythrin domain-containing protein [Nitrospira sp.]HNC84720.1 hemerythrin domain-containing protein [Nitrospira sp.]